MKKTLLIIITIFCCCPNSWSNLKYKYASLHTKVFFTQNDAAGRNVMIKGRIESISTSEDLSKNDLSGIAREKTKV